MAPQYPQTLLSRSLHPLVDGISPESLPSKTLGGACNGCKTGAGWTSVPLARLLSAPNFPCEELGLEAAFASVLFAVGDCFEGITGEVPLLPEAVGDASPPGTAS